MERFALGLIFATCTVFGTVFSIMSVWERARWSCAIGGFIAVSGALGCWIVLYS